MTTTATQPLVVAVTDNGQHQVSMGNQQIGLFWLPLAAKGATLTERADKTLTAKGYRRTTDWKRATDGPWDHDLWTAEAEATK